MKLKKIKRSTRQRVLGLTTRMLALSLTALIASGPVLRPMAATLNSAQKGGNNPKFEALAPTSNATKLYEFKINPPKNGTYTDERTGFQVTVNFDYQKGEAKKVTWSSNYSVYSVLVKGGKNGGNLFKHDSGSKGSTEVITPDNQGVGHGHATFYYCMPTAPAATEPTAPVETEPTAPAATEPTAPAATEPTAPAATEPTAPAETEPTAPAATEPTAPAATEPTAPTATEPTAPAATEPTAPAATEPTAPAETEPTAPAATEPTAPAETEPTAPAATEPTAPAATEPTAPAETEPTAPAETEPTAPAATEPTAPTATEPTAPAATEPTAPAATEPTAPAATEPTAPAEEPVVSGPLSIIDMGQTSGLVTGGDYVTVNGTGFQKGLTATLGGISAAVVNYFSDTQIRIVIPQASAEGVADFIITNPDGKVASLTGAYTYLPLPVAPPPTITSLGSISGLITGGEYVTVNGTGFQKGLTATLGGINATVVNYFSDSQIRIIVPEASAEGVADLIVTNPDGQVASLASAYTYLPLPAAPAPTITSLGSTSGLITGGEYVTVNGTGFQKGLTATLGGINATVVNYFSDTQIRIIIPQVLAEGVADLIVTNPDGQTASLSGAYTYLPLPATPPPTITSLAQTTGLITGGDYVTINGTGFQKGVTVKLGGVDAQVANFYSSTQIRIIIPKVTNAGDVDLEVTNPDGQSTLLSSAYTYTVPVTTINSLSASSGEFSGGYYIYINGINFDPSSTVTVNNVPVAIYYYGSTLIRIVAMPSADTLGLSNAGGIVPIKVTDSLGNSVTANFTYNAKPATPVPQITTMNGAGGAAATGSISGGTYTYFYGAGFTSTMKVRIYDSSNILVKEEAITNFYNSGYARYLMPKVTNAGNYTIKLVNSDGIESNGALYIYTAI